MGTAGVVVKILLASVGSYLFLRLFTAMLEASLKVFTHPLAPFETLIALTAITGALASTLLRWRFKSHREVLQRTRLRLVKLFASSLLGLAILSLPIDDQVKVVQGYTSIAAMLLPFTPHSLFAWIYGRFIQHRFRATVSRSTFTYGLVIKTAEAATELFTPSAEQMLNLSNAPNYQIVIKSSPNIHVYLVTKAKWLTKRGAERRAKQRLKTLTAICGRGSLTEALPPPKKIVTEILDLDDKKRSFEVVPRDPKMSETLASAFANARIPCTLRLMSTKSLFSHKQTISIEAKEAQLEEAKAIAHANNSSVSLVRNLHRTGTNLPSNVKAAVLATKIVNVYQNIPYEVVKAQALKSLACVNEPVTIAELCPDDSGYSSVTLPEETAIIVTSRLDESGIDEALRLFGFSPKKPGSYILMDAIKNLGEDEVVFRVFGSRPIVLERDQFEAVLELYLDRTPNRIKVRVKAAPDRLHFT